MSNPFVPLIWFFAGMAAAGTALMALALCMSCIFISDMQCPKINDRA